MCRLTLPLLVWLLGQGFSPEPARFGALAHTLTPSEIAEIVDIASKERGRPWLLLGHRSLVAGVATIDLYLEPDVKGAQVSRGRMFRLIADDPPAVQRRSAWRVQNAMPFAYIGSPLRPSFNITSEHDLDWPFAI